MEPGTSVNMNDDGKEDTVAEFPDNVTSYILPEDVLKRIFHRGITKTPFRRKYKGSNAAKRAARRHGNHAKTKVGFKRV